MDKSVLLLIFFIFIAGTFTASVNHVSASELVKDSWNTKTPMNYERSSGGVVVLDGKIFVIGGYNNGWYESANECYDPETD
ncbi:MAG: hypothetical protein LBC03_03740, partial [Nitrososphaerota archaeon]|nr:hypothetical protein [Nitrososphaerota archaeon]